MAQNNMKDLQTCFVDLGAMVNNQQSMIDTIEMNVSDGRENAKQAMGQLQKVSRGGSGLGLG